MLPTTMLLGKHKLQLVAPLLAVLALCGCKKGPAVIQDEAMKAGRTAASLPAADEDYFHAMDRGQKLTPAEVKGRNNWNVWTGGNDRLWDYLANNSFGSLDLLKTVSSHPKLGYGRHNRWKYLGVVNEPCYKEATKGDDSRYGLWLDSRTADCGLDPFENESKYPGVKIGARGNTLPVGSFYGYGTGILGLRLFPNPEFDEKAKAKWDAKRYYEDPSYYSDRKLIRPFRVGMTCGFCHIGPSPTNPPADPENPKWENLNSNPGAQYFWTDRIFYWQKDDSNFIYQLFHTYNPGTLDTSFVSTDSINNPRTMNAIYNVMPRIEAAKRWKEHLAGDEQLNKQFNDYPQTSSLSSFFQKPDTVFTPRVLKDGSDSVGVLGALNRVYINIGLFSEEWTEHFRPLIGGKRISPIKISDLAKNSAYWNATTEQTPDVAQFFLATAKPDHLKDAPGGESYLTKDKRKLDRGKIVFAENCARCHSSKQPPSLCEPGHPCQQGEMVKNSTEYLAWMRNEVQKPDFLEGNFLSTDERIPVSETGTNACSPLASNAIRDNIWDNFSSETYKNLPAVGSVTVYNPVDGTPSTFNMPAGGRGYTRPPSLISAWATAPFLLNNSVGEFDPDPSVASRMRVFNDAIEQMLWPEKRKRDPEIGDKVPGPSYIQRTTRTSYLKVSSAYFPDPIKDVLGALNKDEIVIGPIPAGTPVSLLANLDVTPEGHDLGARVDRDKKLAAIIKRLVVDLKKVKGKNDEEARAIFRPLVPELMQVSKCPDYIVNKGHYFGSNLPDSDKRALIEFIKTF